MTTMNKNFAAFILSLVLASVACARPPAPAVHPAFTEATRWLSSPEFKQFVAKPDVLFTAAATEDHYSAQSVAALRAWAIAHLPPTVRDYRSTDAAQLAKLNEALRPLTLRFPVAGHLEIFLFESESPYVALGEKTMLVISASAVRGFTQEELRAVVAHELGHLYNTDALAEALAAGDANRLQLYELQADAIGAVLIAALGEQPETLFNAVRRLHDFQEQYHLLDPALVSLYPTLDERKLFSERVAQLLKPDAAQIGR